LKRYSSGLPMRFSHEVKAKMMAVPVSRNFFMVIGC